MHKLEKTLFTLFWKTNKSFLYDLHENNEFNLEKYNNLIQLLNDLKEYYLLKSNINKNIVYLLIDELDYLNIYLFWIRYNKYPWNEIIEAFDYNNISWIKNLDDLEEKLEEIRALIISMFFNENTMNLLYWNS